MGFYGGLMGFTRPGERLHFAMERSTMLLMGKSQLFRLGHFQWQNVSSPEGIWNIWKLRLVESMWNQVFWLISYVFVVKVLLPVAHVAGGTFPARPGWCRGRFRWRGGSGAAEWNGVAPGGQVQRAAHVLRQQDGASGGKLGELNGIKTSCNLDIIRTLSEP